VWLRDILLCVPDTLFERLEKLDRSLQEFKPTDHASWMLGRVFNVLLDEVKKQRGDDMIVSVIEPAEQGTIMGVAAGEDSNMTVGTMRAAIAQLMSAL
jgi:hypothetical protein